MAELAKLFGARVRALRAERRFSQAELAERAGLSEEWIRRMERGQASPSFQTIQSLAEALGAHAHEFFVEGVASAASERLAAAGEGLNEDQVAWLLNGARLLRVISHS